MIVLLPGGIALFRWSQLSYAQKMTGVLLFFIGINQVLASVISFSFKITNLPLYHLYILIETIALFVIFNLRFRQPYSSRFVLGGIAVIFLFNLCSVFLWEGIFQMPQYSRTFESIVIIGLTSSYFIYVMKEVKVKQLEKSFWFWMSCGLLIYFSTNLFLFVFSNYIVQQSKEIFSSVWLIHSILNIILYVFYSIALRCKDRISYHFI